LLETIPNLRKVGVPPWSDIDKCAELINTRYVMSRKPNPANVAVSTDPEVIRRELTETIEACKRHGCVFDYVLKDISTVSYKLENLVIWEKTVHETIDKYY
jgi:hypothetical protein